MDDRQGSGRAAPGNRPLSTGALLKVCAADAKAGSPRDPDVRGADRRRSRRLPGDQSVSAARRRGAGLRPDPGCVATRLSSRSGTTDWLEVRGADAMSVEAGSPRDPDVRGADRRRSRRLLARVWVGLRGEAPRSRAARGSGLRGNPAFEHTWDHETVGGLRSGRESRIATRSGCPRSGPAAEPALARGWVCLRGEAPRSRADAPGSGLRGNPAFEQIWNYGLVGGPRSGRESRIATRSGCPRSGPAAEPALRPGDHLSPRRRRRGAGLRPDPGCVATRLSSEFGTMRWLKVRGADAKAGSPRDPDVRGADRRRSRRLPGGGSVSAARRRGAGLRPDPGCVATRLSSGRTAGGSCPGAQAVSAATGAASWSCSARKESSRFWIFSSSGAQPSARRRAWSSRPCSARRSMSIIR